MQNNRFERKGRFLFPLFFMLMWLLLGAIVMWLWNAILPSLLHTNNITYWQSVGLLIVCRILFGSFRFNPPKRPGWSNHYSNLREKWKTMSEEEKAKFRNEMRNRCRPPQPPEEKKGL